MNSCNYDVGISNFKTITKKKKNRWANSFDFFDSAG